MRKQQIRPRFVDLAEFDDDMPEDSTSRRAALDSFSNWPPAATVVRKKPPQIASSSKSDRQATAPLAESSLKASVEDADDSQAPAQKTTPQPQPRTVRFDPETTSQNDELKADQAPPKATLDFAGSIIGSISERPVGERRARPSSSSRSTKASGSRFVVRKRMDEDLQKHEEQRFKRLQEEETPHGQEPGTGFPVVSHRDQIDPILPSTSGKARATQFSEDITTVAAPQRDTLATQTTSAANNDDEEWLDEDGRPMSAFRKSRLIRQGQRPPSIRSRGTATSSRVSDDRQSDSFKPDPTRDPGGGADIDAITAVLSDVSRENDQKLRQMSATEVSEEIRSLENLFGKDVLDALRNRKGSTNHGAGNAASKPARSNAQVDATANATAMEADEFGPLAIKRQYFPGEPEGPNPSLEWIMPQPSSQQLSSEVRFDFSGQVIQRGGQTDETYLSGLHHHGDNQEAPGYTFAELIYLSRSTVAAQRQLALNVLGRICEQHPTFSQDSKEAVNLLNDKALLLRARVISISRWLLGDRHFTVRSAALRCLTSAVRSLPSGVSLPLGAAQELGFNKLFSAGAGDEDDRSEASEVELSIQKDWASVMLDSNIISLFLDRTDSVITSKWEAELALELLFRIASCSSSHASQVFEADTTRLSDFITHLGLKVPWPPVPSDCAVGRPSALPSIAAVRLLHQGILSDRKIAQEIVLSGNIEHLLRFVVTTPWKVEQDWASNDEEGDATVVVAYGIFDEVLQLFASLAQYGFFASVVTRTWDLWQECGNWAVTQIVRGHAATERGWVEEARTTAAQRIFEILASWTRCAMDPHELMTAHDITWSQVRDWVELVRDAAQQMPGSQADSSKAAAFGALCRFVDVWMCCAIGKESIVPQQHLESCKAVMSHSREPIQRHFQQIVALFTSAPTLDVALDEAEQACKACHRCFDLSRTFARAEAVAAGQSDAAQNSDIMLQEGLALIACGPLWDALKRLEPHASGRQVYRETFSDFVAATVAARSSVDSHSALELAAVTRLDERHAGRVAHIVLQAAETLAGADTAHALRPVLLECIVGSNRLPDAAGLSAIEHRDSTPLSQITSLFRPSKSAEALDATEKTKHKQEDGDEDEAEEDDIDPITGTKLWKCPASGLPVRPDWPLLALDDLLHSGNTGVFNRPDNLDADWKPSELDMVRSSLQLAVSVFRTMLTRADVRENALTIESKAVLCSLPNAEQILLGLMKVFLLEKDQPDTFTDKTLAGGAQQKQSGTLTGRDLFRDPTISSHLTALMDIADELVLLRQRHCNESLLSAVTLDTWTATTYGGGMSFYQLFTDLVGLWDSVSFGDGNFARIIMTIANAGCQGGVFEGESGIAVDFRRLVWNDYSVSLRNMPPGRLPDWVLGWEERDVDMLECYCRYLASAAEVGRARESPAWQVATHHVGAALKRIGGQEEEEGGKEKKRTADVLKSLFVAKGEGLLRELLSSSTSPDRDISEEGIQQVSARLGLSSAQR